MMNLISFETPPLARHESTATRANIGANDLARSSSTCNFHGSSHLDLSLGISLSSPRGSGGRSCHAACSGAKESNRGDVGCVNGGLIVATNDNVVREGYGCRDTVSSSSWTAAFMPSYPTGFMHPWSLAARQQKAAAEQDRSLGIATYVTSDAPVVSQAAAAVGWPPVHTARRNLVTAMHVPRTDATVKLDEQKEEKMAAAIDETNGTSPPRSCTATEGRQRRANMFAKVHMDGCLVGRKINLRAHRSYDSLSRTLGNMIRNFFCPATYSSSNRGEDCANSQDLIFLYEDFERDRMLVGDVPWERAQNNCVLFSRLFLASAKRLYIAQNPTSPDHKGNNEDPKKKVIMKLENKMQLKKCSEQLESKASFSTLLISRNILPCLRGMVPGSKLIEPSIPRHYICTFLDLAYVASSRLVLMYN